MKMIVFLISIKLCVLNLLIAVAQQNFDFRTRVLAEDRRPEKVNQTIRKPVVYSPTQNGKRLRLQDLINRRTKPVCSKEVLTRNATNEYITILSVCCVGFKQHPQFMDRCIPDCEEKCTNGQCIAPNICRCFPGFVPNLSQDCVSTCPLGCINGRCNSNGTCICNSGYQLESKGKYCIPICKEHCGHNKNCTAPGECSCYKGYIKNSKGECVPICENDCLHGVCVAPNTCSCHAGYNLRDGICQASCEQNCINGRCIAQNHCLCDHGYYRDPKSGLCVPKCTNCNNGVCAGAENCECFKGYQNANSSVSSTCIPHCPSGCYGGLCYAPNKCDCSFYAINIAENCRSTGKCVFFFGGICLWWIDY